MIGKLKYLFGVLSLGMLSVAVFSCGKDEGDGIDEWSSDYVYLERPVLGYDELAFFLTHTGSGVGGDVEPALPVGVRLLKPTRSDVTVHLSVTLDGLPDGSAVFRHGGTVVIPAGEAFASDTLDVATDWSFVEKPQAVYTATVAIESITPVSESLRVSSNQGRMSMVITKTAYLNLSYSTSDNVPGARITNRSAWTIVLAPNVENASNPGRLVDGNGGTDIASNRLPYWLTIDLSQITTVTGFYVRSWGGSYAPRAVEIFTSADGSNWISQGQLATSASANQYITLLDAVTCRHIRYEVLVGASSGRMSLTEFYVYQRTP